MILRFESCLSRSTYELLKFEEFFEKSQGPFVRLYTISAPVSADSSV